MPSTTPSQYDPVFLNARREALIVLAVWFLCLCWSIGCYAWLGRRDPAEVQIILGVPDWVMAGIVVPWLLADIFAVWFCFFYMTDDDLGESETADNDEAHGTLSRRTPANEA